jgi:hypothetical protein
MTHKSLETTLTLLAEKRDSLNHSVEFAATNITPPPPCDHLHKQIADIEAAIAEIELTHNVRIVRKEDV